MTDRRRLLQSAALLGFGLPVVAGCTSDEVVDGDGQTPRAPRPEEAAELELIAAYDAALAGAPKGRREVYERIREEHVQHLRAVGGSGVSAGPSSSAPARAPGRRALILAERRATRSATTGAATADDPDRAQLLALIAASEAQHAAALEQL
jgi:hypothetical protein